MLMRDFQFLVPISKTASNGGLSDIFSLEFSTNVRFLKPNALKDFIEQQEMNNANYKVAK